MPMNTCLPISLYIHIPWCVRKCPYCDFNSHTQKGALPEAAYIEALLHDLDCNLAAIADRNIISIFFGGGTPSLFQPESIAEILSGVRSRVALHPNVEITLEANPGTVDAHHFLGFKQAGINRLSLGVQSLQDEKLKQLGRIHDSELALSAILAAKKAGFHNFNIDIMFGLPNQSIEDAMQDIAASLAYSPPHFSWYQLTLEPNTLFYREPPALPNDDIIWEMQMAGCALLQTHGYQQYEVSAYSRQDFRCQHNLNYWAFGDYLGIGAGAHSKITDNNTGKVVRFAQPKHPRDYLDASKRASVNQTSLAKEDLIFEFMLNALRLTDGVPWTLFTERTGINFSAIAQTIARAQTKNLLEKNEIFCRPTVLGQKFLNNLIGMFLPYSPGSHKN